MAHRLVKSDLAELFASRSYKVSDFGRTLKFLAVNFEKHIKRCAFMRTLRIWNQIVKILHSCREIYVQIHAKIKLFSLCFLKINNFLYAFACKFSYKWVNRPYEYSTRHFYVRRKRSKHRKHVFGVFNSDLHWKT